MGCCQSQKDEPLLQLDGEYPQPILSTSSDTLTNTLIDRAPSPYILDSDQIIV